jgi:hypothetical protein
MRLLDDATLEFLSKPFKYIERLIIFFYIIVYIGVLSTEPLYIQYLSNAFHAFVCVFLLYKFNPFREHKLNKHDGKIIFASALFMLTNIGITETIHKIIPLKV